MSTIGERIVQIPVGKVMLEGNVRLPAASARLVSALFGRVPPGKGV